MNENITNYTEDNVEISLEDLLNILKKNWLVIFLISITIFILGSLYTTVIVDKKYTANASVMVSVQNENGSQYNDILTGQRLATTYVEVAKSDLVINGVKANLNLDMSVSQIRSFISVSNVRDTPILKLSVTHTDSKIAKNIANEIVDMVKIVSNNFHILDNIDVLDYATTPTSPSSPNVKLYIAASLMLGLILGVSVVFLKEVLDKTIKNTKDIEGILGLRVLGTIPEYNVDKLPEGEL